MTGARLARQVQTWGCTMQEQTPMAAYTSFKIGGPAAWMVTAPTAEAVAQVLALCREETLSRLFLGNGSNLLVSDAGFPGVVLRYEPPEGPRITSASSPEAVTVTCPAGVPLKQLCLFAAKQGLAGLEFAYGIPGTVGGAVYMNAGAYDGQMADVLEEAQTVSASGEAKRVPVSAMKLMYRHSVFMETDEVVTDVTLRLHADNPAAVTERMDAFMRRRREKQPLEYPSAGSFFKRPAGCYAGALLEQCGLKGFTVGGAQISEKHAGFVINRGGATCGDVLSLAEQAMTRVWKQCGVCLEPEVRILGEDGTWQNDELVRKIGRS